MKSVVPVLIIGVVLAVIVFAARCSQRKMHEYETAHAPAENPNSAPNELAEAERMAQRFPDTLLSTSGLRYRVLREGTGARPIAGSRVKAHYTGRLLDGTEFDSSYPRGQPYEFTLMAGEVIRGWDLAILEMHKGEKRLVVIPFRLAYGVAGRPPTIPQLATLVFEIELVDFR